MAETHDEKYLEHAWQADLGPWLAPHPYVPGVRVVWHDVRLVCTLDHYAGGEALHPWDPGCGWEPWKAAALWTPDGEVETAKLIGVAQNLEPTLGPGEDDRLRIVLALAGGVAG